MKHFFLFVVMMLCLSLARQANSEMLSTNPDSIPFAPAVNYPAGDGPVSVFCAHLDADDHLDLAVTNVWSNNVSILKNNGDGTFYLDSNYTVGDYPYSVFCACLDTDDHLDLAVANVNSGTVSILFNQGDGSFHLDSNYAVGSSGNSVFCADLDADFDLDLAVTNSSGDSISIWKNYGNGTFYHYSDYLAEDHPRPVFCANLDTDSCLDLAVPTQSSDSLIIFKNKGDGNFERHGSYEVGDLSSSVFCADLDGDSSSDLAVGNALSNNVSILKNNGDGTFYVDSNYATGDNPHWVFCADLDGDGDLDLVVPNLGSHNVSILQNNGDGTFRPATNYAVGNSPGSVFCADLDEDQDLDLAVSNYGNDSVSILLNLTNSRPDSFSLQSPQDSTSVWSPLEFDWEDAFDPDSNDTVWYGLLVSRSQTFHPDSTTTFDSLLQSQYMDNLAAGEYYWKVKAYDTWGAVTSSNETWSFVVQEVCDSLFISTETVCLAPHLMKVMLTVANCDTLSAMTTPLHYETDCPGFTVDSVTFWGSRIENWEFKHDSIRVDTVVLGLIADVGGGTPPLPPGEGPIAHVYFSIPCDPENVYDTCFIAWDTTTVQPEDQGLLFVDNHGNEFVPNFEPGTTFVALYRPGDVNCNCEINVGDVVYLIMYLFRGGPEPCPLDAGDVNGDCNIDIGDVVYLVNYLYKGGPPPVCGCASHPELAGGCGECEGTYTLHRTAGSAQVRLAALQASERGKEFVDVDGSFGTEVAGIQLELSYDPGEIESITPALTDRTQDMKLFFSAANGMVKIGIVDLAGEHVVPPGQGSLLKLRMQGSNYSSLELNKAILVDEEATALSVAILPKEDGDEVAPRDFILSQNHPNPFNPETEISYTLPEAAQVKLAVYNVLGRKVRELVDEYQALGRRTVHWDGKDDTGSEVASGIYFYRIDAAKYTETKKMILMR